MEYTFFRLYMRKHFDIRLLRTKSVRFVLKDGIVASKKKRRIEKLFVSRQSRHFRFDFINASTIPICSVTWDVNN